MLSDHAQDLYAEIREAEEQRDDYLGTEFEDLIRRYAGPGYRTNWKRSDVDFENTSYEWLSIFLPELISGMPRVKASTPRMGYPQKVARATQLAVNRGIKRNKSQKLLEKLAVDWAFRWAVAMTLPERVPGPTQFGKQREAPLSRRISPRDYINDYAAFESTDERFRGHKVRRDKEDILQEADEDPKLKWNVELVLSLAEDQLYKGRENQTQDRKKHNVSRGEVEFYELWIPEIQLDGYSESDGYHGAIYTIGMSSSTGDAPSDYLRPPRPFWGPREGPYSMGGYLIVPDEVMPLAPIAAGEAQTEELNNMRKALSANMESYARGVAIDSTVAGDTAEKWKEWEDLNVFVLPNADDVGKKIKEVTKGGVDEVYLTQFQFLKDARDRAMGMSESVRGNAPANTTATAEDIASQSSGRRKGLMTQKFLDLASDIFQKEAWYHFHDENAYEHLGPEGGGLFIDPETQEPVEELIMRGGGDTSMWEELDIAIEPLSVRHTSEALEEIRSQKVDNIILSVGPILPQLAMYTDLERWLTWKGEEVGRPDLAKLFDLNAARAVGEAMMQTQGSPQPQGQTKPQPRLGGDIPQRLQSPGFSQKANKTGQATGTQLLQASGTSGGRSQVFSNQNGK